jgi:Flp pilus assembly protein TadG
VDGNFHIRSQRGATAIEFALVLQLVILLIFGTIEFSLFMFNKQVIINATREGARAGIVARPTRMSNTDITTIVENYSQQHLVTFGTNNPPTVTIKPIDNDLSDGFNPGTHRCVLFNCDLEVATQYQYSFLVLDNFGIGPVNIAAVSRMKME